MTNAPRPTSTLDIGLPRRASVGAGPSDVSGVRAAEPVVPVGFDTVERPFHYTGKRVECIEAIECCIEDLSGIDGHLTAQIMKYLWRQNTKHNRLEDLRKARQYLDRLISRVAAERQEDGTK